MGVVESFMRPFDIGVDVKGITIVLTAKCNCGNPDPLQIPFISTGQLYTQCGKCQTRFFLGRISFDAEKPSAFTVAVAAVPATIVKPPAGLDVRT